MGWSGAGEGERSRGEGWENRPPPWLAAAKVSPRAPLKEAGPEGGAQPPRSRLWTSGGAISSNPSLKLHSSSHRTDIAASLGWFCNSFVIFFFLFFFHVESLNQSIKPCLYKQCFHCSRKQKSNLKCTGIAARCSGTSEICRLYDMNAGQDSQKSTESSHLVSLSFLFINIGKRVVGVFTSPEGGIKQWILKKLEETGANLSCFLLGGRAGSEWKEKTQQLNQALLSSRPAELEEAKRRPAAVRWLVAFNYAK